MGIEDADTAGYVHGGVIMGLRRDNRLADREAIRRARDERAGDGS